jgi:hypothetical protein
MNVLQKMKKILLKTFLSFADIICILSVIYVLLYMIYIIGVSLATENLTDVAIDCILLFGALMIFYIFSDMIS